MNTTIIIIVFIATVAVSFYFDYRFRKKREACVNALLNDLMSGNFEAFDQKMADKDTAKLIPPFNIKWQQKNSTHTGRSHSRCHLILHIENTHLIFGYYHILSLVTAGTRQILLL